MAIDWDLISDLDQIDADNSEDLYDQLDQVVIRLFMNLLSILTIAASSCEQIDPYSLDDVDKFRKLFSASKRIMKIKTQECKVALEYIDELSKTKVDRSEYEAVQAELRVYRQTIDPRDSNSLTENLKELNLQITNLQKEVESKESELQKCKKKLQESEKHAELKERECETLAREVDALREELDSHRNGFSETFIEREDYIEKLRTKNTQIHRLLDEIREFELANKDLEEKVVTLKRELSEATHEVRNSSHDVEAINSRLHEIQILNQTLLKDKEQLMSEVSSLQELVNRLKEEEERTASKFSAQVDRVMEMMNEKDNEILQLQKTLKLHLGRDNVSDLVSTKDSESEVRLLKDQLDDACNALHQQNLLVEYLREECNKRKEQEAILMQHKDDTTLMKQVNQLEQELKVKDVTINELRTRNQQYEQQHYGLNDAVRQLESAQKAIQSRDKRISEQITQINHLAEELNDCQEELEYIRECAQIKGIDVNYGSKSDAGEGERRSDKMRILKLQQQLVKLEDDKISLEEEMRHLRKSCTTTGLDDMVSEFKSRIFLLETENADLRQGMKEILMGVQESDGRSDVSVECPSLERVCQLLESRSISDSLANVIALKAELDLMRGFNQQLRTELKRVRCEHLNILSLYTEDVLIQSGHDVEDLDFSQLDVSEGELLQFGELISESGSTETPASQVDDDRDEVETEKLAPILTEETGEMLTNTRNEGTTSSQAVDADDTNEKEEAADEAENRLNDGHEDESEEENTMTMDVPLVVCSKLDNTTQTDEVPNPKPRNQTKLMIQRPAPGSQDQRCQNCLRFVRVISEIHSRLNRMERSIQNGEDLSLERIQHLQNQHQAIVNDLENRMKSLNDLLNRKDLLIQHLKETASKKRIPRRETFTIALPTDQTLKLPESESIEYTTDLSVSDVSRTQDVTTENRQRDAEIIENVIECLQQRLTQKNNTINDYRRLLQETKESFEREINCVLDQKNANQDEDISGYNLKTVFDNEQLQQLLNKCMKELEDLKKEASGKIKDLELMLQQKVDRIAELENENESLQRKCSLSLSTQLKNQVNQLKDEVKRKDRTIAGLEKSLKDERMLRIGTLSAKVSKKVTSSNSNTSIKDQDREGESVKLREEIESKKRLIRDIELNRWETEKKLKELLEATSVKLKEKTVENEKLTGTVDRLKSLLLKRESVSSKSVRKKKFVTFSADQEKEQSDETKESSSCAAPHVEAKASEASDAGSKTNRRRQSCPSITGSTYHPPHSSSPQRETELQILLQESLQREKLAALRLTSQMQEISADQLLLQENAHLKVELRMAEFELRKIRQQEEAGNRKHANK